MSSCSFVLNGSNQVGIDVPHSGAVVYGGQLAIKANIETAGATCISVAAGAAVHAMGLTLYVENNTGGGSFSRVKVGAGGEFSGFGDFAADGTYTDALIQLPKYSTVHTQMNLR